MITLQITPEKPDRTPFIKRFISRPDAQEFIDDMYGTGRMHRTEWNRLTDILSEVPTTEADPTHNPTAV